MRNIFHSSIMALIFILLLSSCNNTPGKIDVPPNFLLIAVDDLNEGSEEFYDHSSDPHEWYNLIESTSPEDLISMHREHLPQEHHPILGKNSTGHKAYFATEELMN